MAAAAASPVHSNVHVSKHLNCSLSFSLLRREDRTEQTTAINVAVPLKKLYLKTKLKKIYRGAIESTVKWMLRLSEREGERASNN